MELKSNITNSFKNSNFLRQKCLMGGGGYTSGMHSSKIHSIIHANFRVNLLYDKGLEQITILQNISMDIHAYQVYATNIQTHIRKDTQAQMQIVKFIHLDNTIKLHNNWGHYMNIHGKETMQLKVNEDKN